MTNLQPNIHSNASKLTPELTAELIEKAFDVTSYFGCRLKHCSFKTKGTYIRGSAGDIDLIAMQLSIGPIVITRDGDEIKMIVHESYNNHVEVPVNDMQRLVLDSYF